MNGLKIEIGNVYQHISVPERKIVVLTKPKRRKSKYTSRRRVNVEVEYLGATNKENIGLVSVMNTKFIRKKYKYLYSSLPRRLYEAADWRV